MEVERVKDMMNKMSSLINGNHPMFSTELFSTEYLMRMFGLRKKDIRIEKINRIFNE
jgi:hypothetical protein